MQLIKNVAYVDHDTAHPLQAFDLYLPYRNQAQGEELPALLVYIHGGAWRTGDKTEHATTLFPRLSKRLSVPIVSLNYRLSHSTTSVHPGPHVTHPGHYDDVVSALEYLTQDELLPCESGSRRWRRDRVILVGHSAGAFLAATTSQLLKRPLLDGLVASRRAKHAIIGVALLEGIYGLKELVDMYPAYRDFVTGAFPYPANWHAASPLNWEVDSGMGARCKVLVVNSPDDRLVRKAHAMLMSEKLKQAGVDVKVDWENVKGDHDELLDREEIVGVLAKWIKGLGL